LLIDNGGEQVPVGIIVHDNEDTVLKVIDLIYGQDVGMLMNFQL
jgi:hypothetical protein